MNGPVGTHIPGVRNATLDGLIWGMGGKTLLVVGALAVLMVTSRTLTPTQFGVFAAATIFADLSLALATSTFGVALIQKSELTDEVSRAGMVAFAGAGVGLSAVMIIGSTLLESLFSAPGLAPVLVGMGLAVPFRVMSGYYGALIQRRLDLRYYQMTQNLPQLLGGCGITVFGALAGWGVWCLVAGYAVSAALEFMLTLWRARPAHRLPQRLSSMRDLLQVGGGSAANRMANFAAISVDRTIIGIGLGAASLGLYTRAYGLMMVPVKVLGMAISRTFLSVFSRLQDDEPRLSHALMRILCIQPMIFIPIGIALMLATPALVPLVLGSGWAAVVLPAQILFGALVARLGYVAPEQAAIAIGEAWGSAGRQAIYAVLVCIGAVAGLAVGLAGVAAGVTLALIIFYGLSLRRASIRLGCSARMMARAHMRALLLALTGLPPALLVGWMTVTLTQMSVFRPLVEASVYSLCIAVVLILAPKAWLGDAVGDMRRDALSLVRRRVGRTSSRPV